MSALLSSLPVAAVGQPLFGNLWLAALVVLAGVALFMAAVALVGRWLAATHPEAPRKVPPAPVAPAEIRPEILAIIASAVNVTLGPRAEVKAVELAPVQAPSVESLMLQWSLEGRRQIYSSHKVR